MTDQLTETPAPTDEAPGALPRRSAVSRFGDQLRRLRPKGQRPFRRFLIVTHRWLSLVLGLVLLVISTSGAILVYKGEFNRATHGDAYAHSSGPATVNIAEARQAVLAAHPKFDAHSVWLEHGVYRVTDSDYATYYPVDPGTGKVLGYVGHTPTWIGWLDNLHECFLSCEGEPGYLSFLNKPVPGTGWLGFDGEKVTWGGTILLGFALVLLYLSLTGLWLWFPRRGKRPGKWKKSVSVRWKKGRFARDTDLHNVAGLIAIPLLLLWAVTGMSYESELVEKGLYKATFTHTKDYIDAVSAKAPKGTPDITEQQAIDAAEKLYPKAKLVNVDLPTKDDPTSAYTMYFADGYDAYGQTDYPGDLGVFVDRHTGVAKANYGFTDEPEVQRVWEDFNYPAHSGYIVNGWWKIIWLVLGLSPLLLAVTGVSTWLVRRKTRKNRKNASRAGTNAAVPTDVAEVLADDPESAPDLATAAGTSTDQA